MHISTLRRRLLFSHTIPVILLTLLLGIVLIYVLESQVVLTNLSTQMSRQALLLADFTADYPQVWNDTTAAQALVDRFKSRMTAQLMLVAADGTVLASSDPEDAALLGQPIAAPAMDGVRGGEMVVEASYSQDQRAEIADIWAPAFAPDGRVAGAVRLTHQLRTVQERFQRLRDLTLDVLAAGLLLGTATALLLAATLERPITRLTRAVERLAHGAELAPLPEEGLAELRVLAIAFNDLLDRLRVLRAGRRQLLANLVHELGRPLGALRSASQALLDGAAEEPELRDALLQGIDAELRSMQRLLDDLTRYYDRELGALDLHLQPTSLSGWLPIVLGHWAGAARARGIVWHSEIPPDLPRVDVDPDRLAQVVGNLLSNALKFTPPGERVAVTAGAGADGVWIQVRDSGPGIAAADHEQVFEPFARGSQRSRLPEGMGLGLGIARDLVQAHGGQLELQSAPGVGAAFTIRLPLPNSSQP